MPFFQENTSNPIRGILVIASLWLSIGLNHVYAQVPSYVPTNGLVGWWPLDGTGNDLVNQNNFSIYGPTGGVNRFGISNGCFDFNGTNLNAQYLETTNISSFFTSNYTYSGWFSTDIIRPNTGGLTWPDQGIICLGPSNYSTGNSVHIALLESSLFASHWTSNTSWVGPSTGNGTIQVNQWYHIVVSYNSGISKIYLNGQLISQLAIPISYSQSVKLIIGGNAETPNGSVRSGFDGKIDDIGFWSRALSQSEITALYNAQSTSPCTANIITQDTTICLGSSVTLRAPALTTTTVPSAGNCSNGIGTWEQLFTSAQLSGYSINRTNGYAFDTATGIYYSVSGSTTLKLDLVNKTITPFTQSGQNSSFSHGIFNYLDQKLYAHRVGRDVVYNVPKAGGTWTVYGSGSFDANSYGSQPFYDAQNNRVGFFGGYGFYSVKNWVYESTSTGWVNPYANNNNCNPARRNATGIAPSKDYKKMYIFSGAGNCNGSQTASSCTLGQAWASDVGKWCWLQDLYEYDFTTHSFTTILPTASPSISQEGSFAYNYDNDVFYILGGFTPPVTYSATWGNTAPYTNTVLMMDRGAGATSFSQVSICGTPPPVGTVSSSQGMAFYDGPRDRIIWMRPDGIWALNLNTSTTTTTSSRLWSTGDSAQTIVVTPTQTTTYWLTNTINGSSCTDSVTVYVNNPTINTSNTQICAPGDSTLIYTGALANNTPPNMTYMGVLNGRHYYLSNFTSTWQSAEAYLNSYNGHLVSINSQSEQDFVHNNRNAQEIWLGASDSLSEGTFTWTDGTPFTYTNWRSGEPNNSGGSCRPLGEDYALMEPSGLWNDGINKYCSTWDKKYFVGEFISNSTKIWSTGATTDSIWVKPTSTTTYWVQQTINGVSCTDSITISVSGTHISASDTIVCAGSPVTLTAGGSAQFNGNSGFISFPNAGPTGQSPRSFSMWFKTNSTTEMDLLGYGTRSCTQALELKLNDNLNYSASYNNSPCTLLQGVSTNFECHGSNWSTNVSDDQWHHVVYVLGENGNYSYSNIKAYLDGVLISTNPGCFHNWGGWTYNTGAASPMVIGKRFDGNQHFFNGTIDEVSIWNSALNSSQVSGIYQNGVVPTDPNLAHYYDFNNISNGQVPDLVGSNHGSIQGGAWQSGLQAGTGARSFLWSTGDTTPSISVNPAQTTTYWLTTTSNGTSCTDSIQIIVLDAQIGASATTICAPGDSVLLWDNSPSTGVLCGIPQNLQSNLVGWYPFCGDVLDYSGNGNHGIPTNVNFDLDRFNNPNAAIQLTGNGFVEIPGLSNMAIENHSFSAWYKSTNTALQLLAYKTDFGTATDEGFGMYLDPNNQIAPGQNVNFGYSVKVNGNCQPGFGWVRAHSPTFPKSGEYHHVVGVTNADSILLYVDGQMVKKVVRPNGNVDNCSSSIWLGRDWPTNQLYNFKGQLDDVAIWSRPLSKSEVQTLYSISSTSWSTNQTSDSIWVKPSQTTTYTLTKSLNGVTCSDSITITVTPVRITALDTVVCLGGTTALSVQNAVAPFDSTGYNFLGSYNGKKYYVDNANIGWSASNAKAQAAGANLVVIDDINEHNFIASTIAAKYSAAYEGFHIGIYQDLNSNQYSEPSGGWVTVSGQPVTYFNWGSFEPNNSGPCGAENFGMIYNSNVVSAGQWNDECDGIWNGSTQYRGIVEVTPGGQQYLWSTGDTAVQINVSPTQTTTYWVQSLNGTGCIDSVTINVLNPTIFTSQVESCNPGDSVLLYTGSVATNIPPNMTYKGMFNGHHYYLSNYATTWHQATNYLNQFGGQLVSINSAAEQNYINSFGISQNAWIGGTDTLNEGSWVLPDGSSFSYTNWAPGEPNNQNNEDFVEFYTTGQWNDIPPGINRHFIGEFANNQGIVWSTGAINDSIWVTPNQTTTYWVQSTINGVVCTDSATITVSTAQIAPIDSVICLGESVLLTAMDSTLGSYQWSTGDTIAWITVQPSQTTKYWLTTLKNGQTCSDTVTIYVNNIGLQTSTNFVCEPGDSVLIWTNSSPISPSANTCFPPGASLNNGLLAWYPFCGSAQDASGNGNHAQVFGATLAPDRFGTPLSAYDFDGIDDHLRATVSNLPKGNSARSFAGWVYSDGANASGGSGTIYHHGAISYRQRDCMLQWNNQTFSHIGEGYDFGGGSLPHGSWQHVAFTHDGTIARLYVNGVLRAQSNRNYNTAVGDLFLGFNGNSSHWNGERFNGRIDDFGAWNRVLSAQEIQLLVTNAGNQTLWSNGSTNDSIWVTPAQTTTYSVQRTAMGQTCLDSVTVFVASARIQASDTAICSGGSTTLTASYNGLGQTYLWSTGDTTSQIVVTPVTTSIYTLTTTLSNGLQCVDSVRIHVNNAQITASDTVICSAGDSVLLWVPYQNAGIIPGSWGTGQSSFYSTNFNSGIGAGWSSPTGPLPYTGNRVGPFGAGTLQLNLNNLPCHDSLRFNCLLQLTGSWDGNGNFCCGPDIFNVVVDGSTVFSTTFSMTQYAGNMQSYPAQYNPNNLVNNPQGTGSIGNHNYLLSFNFPHTSSSIEFKLAQPASQGAADEAWYFDDFNLELFECGAGGSSIWSTGQGGDSIWVKPQQTTKYWVKRWMQGIVCSDTITVHVSNLQQNFDPLPDTLVVCTGQSTVVKVGPGFASYQWSDATTDSVKTINTTGTYWVTVTDSLGCQASDTIWVYFSDLVASITKQNDVYCFGGSNGAISLTTFGGQPPYSITWSTGQTGVSGLANLGAGVYWVTVTDAFGCVRRDTVAVGQPTAPLSVNVAVNNVSCFGGSTGSLISVVSGGTAPYTYSWNTVPAQTTSTASNLPAGTYTLFITDANGCNLTVTGVITQPAAPLSASVSGTNVLCFGGTTGTANVLATGGTAPYSYSWNTSPVQTTSTATNLASGTYTVTITDSKNCQTTQSVTITQPNAPLGGTISTTTVNCFGGSNGSATVTPTGGTGPYNFIWTTIPAQTSATASNLPAGTYSVLITDANNCSITRTATVTQPGSALAVSSTFTPVLCFGDATGSATVLASGGTAPYTYQWASIPGLVSNSATNLSAGTYVVLVTDAKGCTQQTNITVTQPSAPLTGTLTVTDVACYGDATGSVTVNMSGGTAPYSYSWPAIPGVSSNSATSLSAGTYTVNVTDANGCTFSLSGTINQPLAPLQVTSSGQDALCFGAPSGFAQVAPSGGTAPYSFNWNTIPAQTTPLASNLTAGTYTCTVTDANGCVQFGVWTVGQPMPLMGTSIANDVSCRGAQDGSIQVAISGGTGNYTITWPNGSNSLSRFQLGPGTYSYTITDENNCSFIGAATINEPDPFRVTVDTVSPKCISTEDGRITVSATGGNGGLTYFINGQVFNGMADGLGVFPYGITIVDQNGCDTSFVVDLSPVYEPCVEIPNWFSPNQNGENELWVIQGFEREELNLIVFNVWGQIVYQTDSDNYVPWDGTYEGVPLPNGDYYYVMTSRDERKYYSGYVTILR